MREGAPGGAALGVWGCKPPAWERHRRGGDRLGDLDAPLWGAIETLAYDQGEGVATSPGWGRRRGCVRVL